jgi:hypothetical protein
VLLLIVWIAVAVLTVVVLGGVAYGVLGAAARLRKEVAGAAVDLRPVLADVQASVAAAERRRKQGSERS